MAKNSKKEKVINETMGMINAALAILDKVPDLEDLELGVHVKSLNPFAFVLQLLYNTVGYDAVLKFLSGVVTDTTLQTIEGAVKTFILTQLKYIFDCTINPFITYDLLKEGVVFDLKTVDLMNMLYFCPIDKSVNNKSKNGKWYYFGCDGFYYPDQLECAEDFNALLWYVKNRTVGTRIVWYGHREQPNAKRHASMNEKQSKSNGIVTLEYSGRPSGLKDAEGNSMPIQTPFNNCIHVFIGNTKPIDDSLLQADNDAILNVKVEQGKFGDTKKQAEEIKAILSDKIKELKTSGLSKDEVKLQKEGYKIEMAYAKTVIDAINSDKQLDVELAGLQSNGIVTFDPATNVYTVNFTKADGKNITIDASIYSTTNGTLTDTKRALYDGVIVRSGVATYRPVKYNYYYHKTLLEFNVDYIFSLKLFEQKVLAARLLDALSGCISVDLDLTIQERMVQNEVRKMINDLIDNDDAVVSDCFFTFDNETYDDLMIRSEHQRLGLLVAPNGTAGQPIDVDAILQPLNSLSPNATREEVQSAIEGSLFEVTKQVYPEYGTLEENINLDWKFNIINEFLQTLAYVLILTVLSPKLYLLIAVNLKIMGRESNFDLGAFIDHFKQLIAGIVKTIRDELMRLFKEWLMDIIGKLAKEISVKLALEQVMYYQQLLQRCIACFNSSTIGWNAADVEYADIYATENNEPVNSEC
jgi:hypothetical protein